MIVAHVTGHGHILSPEPYFKVEGSGRSKWVVTVPATEIFPGVKLGTKTHAQNIKEFHGAYKNGNNGKYPTIRSFFDKYVPGCGNTKLEGEPRKVSGLGGVATYYNPFRPRPRGFAHPVRLHCPTCYPCASSN